VLCLFAGLTLFNIGLANRPVSTDTTLDLISVMVKAFDEGEGGEPGNLECRCVKCPNEEFGCYSYDYFWTTCKSNIGYVGSQPCNGYGRGWAEEHVVNCPPNKCGNEAF